MRSSKLTLSSLALLLLLCAPTLAQSAPASSQYRSEPCPYGVAQSPQGDEAVAQSADVGDGVCAAAGNVGQGSDAVNDALNESSASVSSTSSAAGAASATGAISTADAASAGSAAAGDVAAEGVAAQGVAASSVSSDGTAQTGGTVEGEGSASITELPETGGASPLALAAGTLLVTVGLLTRRIVP